MLNDKGFSLIEVLIVLAIIGIFAFVGIPSFIKTLDSAKIKATEIELQNLRSALNTYYSDYQKYPESLQKLLEEKYIVGEGALKDGWNNSYFYRTSTDNHNNSAQKYTLYSAGKDGIEANEDDIKVSSE